MISKSKLFTRMCFLVAALALCARAVTITGLTNRPDPFNNRAAPPANSDTIAFTLSAYDDARIGIYSSDGLRIKNRLYHGLTSGTSNHYWTGLTDKVPAYAAADTLSYATYLIRAHAGLSTTYAGVAKGTGLIIDDLWDVAVDRYNHIYLCDQTKGIISKIDSLGNLLLKIDIAASPLSITGFNIRGLAVDTNLNIYFSDMGNSKRITKIHAATDYTTVTLQWNQTAVVTPFGLGTDGAGIWVADNGNGNNGRIREFGADGTQLRESGLAKCLDVAVDDTYYYVTESKNSRVYKRRRSDNVDMANWAAGSNPGGIAVDATNGYAFVSMYGANEVYRYNLDGTNPVRIGTGFGTSDGKFSGPSGVGIIPGKSVVVADRGNSRIQLFSPETGLFTRLFNTDPSNVYGPEGVATDSNGYVFAATGELDMVRKFSSSGNYVTSIGSPGNGNGQLDNPRSIAVDASGNVYIGDFNNNRVQRFTKSSETVYSYAWQYAIAQPGDMCIGPDGVLYVLSLANNSLYKLSLAGALIDQISEVDMENNPGGMGVNLVTPTGIAVDYAHNIFITDNNTGDIYRGTILNGSNLPASYYWTRIVNTNDQFYDIDTDVFGHLHVTEFDNNLIRVYTSSGTLIHTYGASGSGNGQFSQPCGIAINKSGTAVWIADKLNNRVQRFALEFDDFRDELVTIGDPSGAPALSGVSFARTRGDSTLISPLSSIHNSASGDTGVTFVLTFDKAMDNTVTPVVTLRDVHFNNYIFSPRTGTNFTNGWLNSATNVWKGWKNIPSGQDGLATIFVQGARSATGFSQSPDPDGTTTLLLDTETPSPSITSPSNPSSTMESILLVSGTAEANARLVVSNYSASSGGSMISEQTGVLADATGAWNANLSLTIGDNYLFAIATDQAGNISAATSPRVKVSRSNLSPGTISISPTSEAAPGDSSQWTFTYTAASSLNDQCFVKIGTPSGWSYPQLNSPVQKGYVSVSPGSGTTLDATAITILNIDTIRVNITSMSSGSIFTLYYGGSDPAGYTKLDAQATCGSNTFGTMLNSSISVPSPSIFVRARPIQVTSANRMPDTTLLGTAAVQILDLTFDNSNDALKAKHVSKIVLRTENAAGSSVAGSTFLSAIRVKDAGTLFGTAVPGVSSDVTITLSTPIALSAGSSRAVYIEADFKNDLSLADSTLRIKLIDSTKVTAVEASSGISVFVTAATEQAFPHTSGSTRLSSGNLPDSLILSSINILPSATLGELEKDVNGLRVIFRHPTIGGNSVKITRIAFDMIPTNPSGVLARKSLRRKGQTAGFFSSTVIETTNPMTFDLALSPITITGGSSDTIDVLFDIVATPSSSIKFTITSAASITAIDAVIGGEVGVKPAVSFPLASSTGAITSGTITPSGKDIDALLVDWTLLDERIESSGSQNFYVTWDNSNVYFCWDGTDFSTAGDLFIYMSTNTNGSAATWNYGGYGTHALPVDFAKANYVFYYDNNSAKGLRNGSTSYGTATFTGSVAASGTKTEIRIPRANLGSPSSLKIIPFVQEEGSATIIASMPYDRAGELVRNPTGAAPQSFISSIRLPAFTMGQTPYAIAVIDSQVVVKPTWTYDAGAGNYATGLTAGYQVVYASISGNQNKIVCLGATNGSFKWEQSFASAPTSVSVWYESASDKDVLMFSEGSNFHSGYDNLNSYSDFAWSPISLGATGGKPARSIPADGGGYDNVYAYLQAGGKLYKIQSQTGSIQFTTVNYSISTNANIAVESDIIVAGCTNGNLLSFTTSGTLQNSYSTGNPINQRISYASDSGTTYCAPDDNNIVVLNNNFTLKWALDLGAITMAAPYFWYGTTPPKLFCPAGNYLRHVRDNGTSGSIVWTYQTTSSITTNPVALGSVVYFSSDDKRNFAINEATGANIQGWPTSVLTGENRSRVVVDGQTNSVFFGGGDGKIYRYPKQ